MKILRRFKRANMVESKANKPDSSQKLFEGTVHIMVNGKSERKAKFHFFGRTKTEAKARLHTQLTLSISDVVEVKKPRD